MVILDRIILMPAMKKTTSSLNYVLVQEREQKEDITEIMVDGVCITGSQSQHASSVSMAPESAIK